MQSVGSRLEAKNRLKNLEMRVELLEAQNAKFERLITDLRLQVNKAKLVQGLNVLTSVSADDQV